ncbi:MAG TPA: TetR/AcrR family transcriptional regulator [Stackebrandtia sp.]|jgi:AcrR family transcriptional regulator|uniref:TetR/AcrR family transcriptional regulator n=1 Tax=Stackebrandtia sp. TaxID=2023065 RepID=UPI002D344D92|nr:TetR/AcrR family transcriptional regulator [Stackebrandtia sp.]HZE38649.1 TetR/AcrR family transcriptional regulator [Stackebrandtia sp.]
MHTDARPARRRRGPELEDALLEAAWEQLRAGGYAAFTIDAVARAVGTSRAVIYRRWPARAALVLAAVRAHAGTVVGHIPDTGSLEGDVLALLHEFAERMRQVGIDVAAGLFSELDEIPEETKGVVPTAFRQVIDQARARGEVGAAAVPDAVLAMPGVLIRYSMIAERAAPSDRELQNIAHQLFLPLVRYHASR